MKRRHHEKFCKKDPDGRCVECRTRLTTQFSAFGDLIRDTNKRIEQIVGDAGHICGSCMPSETDYALSLLFRNTLAKELPSMAESITRSIMKALGEQLSVKVFPLTEKAIHDDLESRHGKRK